MAQTTGPGPQDEALFVQMVAMFQVAALQQMGKMMNPITEKVERDLSAAKNSIDFLEMLKRKTDGNRSDVETEFLDKVIFELQMNFVDETQRADAEDSESDTGEEPEGPGGGEESGGGAPEKEGDTQ